MSLKDAMQKVGLRSNKTENERQRKLTKEKTKVEKHQERRNFCEVCELVQPDVERFKHKNPRIDAEWICVNCADKNEIIDDFRVTAQSEFSKDGKYKRYYGHTVDLSKEEEKVKPDNRKKPNYKHNRNKNHNRGNQASEGDGEQRRAGGRSGGRPGNRSGRPGNRNNRNDNRPGNRNNRNDNRRTNHNRSNNSNKQPKAKYFIDEDGEKNFNC